MIHLYAVHIDRPTTDPPDIVFRTEQEARDHAGRLNRPATVSRWTLGGRPMPVAERRVIARYDAGAELPPGPAEAPPGEPAADGGSTPAQRLRPW